MTFILPTWPAACPDEDARGGGRHRRARGYALHQAALIIPYYRETNPGFAALATRTVEQVLADTGG